MLSYEALRQMVNEEKTKQKMVDLPEGFFEEVSKYLENKRRMSETKEDSWEYESAKRLLQDLLDRRESKTVNLALFHIRSGADPGKLTREEQELFDYIISGIKQFRKKLKEGVEGKMEPMLTIGFLTDTPEFVGLDERNYGPFRKGDVASIPADNARLLVDKGMARPINQGSGK
jgi:DNA replication initiation complex subunit (GINS family)